MQKNTLSCILDNFVILMRRLILNDELFDSEDINIKRPF